MINQAANTSASALLGSDGWEQSTQSTLLRARQLAASSEFRGHAHALRRLFDDINADAVLCLDGRPTVCVKDARFGSDEDVEDIRRRLWNLGATTLLVVERANRVDVFSTLTQPHEHDRGGQTAIVPGETILNLEAIALALRVTQLIRRVETGAIYREHTSLFDPKNAVDRLLLTNLKAARDLICTEHSQKAYMRAHAIIGRFLFSCYLLDRGIIGPTYLRSNGLPDATDMQMLVDNGKGADTLKQLIAALHRDFNGSLFGNSNDEIQDNELHILRRLLSGVDLQSGQKSLFKLYDFSFIPVELISSIYQEFLGAEAEAAAPRHHRGGSPRQHGQRTEGAYYTPPRLAELTVDVATAGWETLLDKRCLDPACGSGVFLVILFVRMAEEWRARNPTADTKTRYMELLRILGDNICGVDVHITACLVTCFSLYLAFLDQMEPKEILDLRDALERDARKKLLPCILWRKDEPRPNKRDFEFDTVWDLNFFDMPPEKRFHLVVGNPPWISRKDNAPATTWLFSEKTNVAAVGLKSNERENALFPAKEVACAFMWKAALHLQEGGRVCQILPSRVILSNNTDTFQRTWLAHHRLETIWLLADYRHILFPDAVCPSLICRYRLRANCEPPGQFDFVSPKVERFDPRQALVLVQPEDQKSLLEADVIEATKREEVACFWKVNHWGTPRDVGLIGRLRSLPRLNRLVSEPPAEKVTQRDLFEDSQQQRHWYKGQGFKPFSEESFSRNPKKYGEPKSRWWKDTARYLDAQATVAGLVLLEDETEPVGKRFSKLHRRSNKNLAAAPLLLINKSCTKLLFSDFDVIFQDCFQSICGPKGDEAELLFLTAVFASDLAKYFLFHTTANIGIERDIARLEEMLELPFPLPEEMPDPRAARSIVKQCTDLLKELKLTLDRPENRLNRHALVRKAKQRLNQYVYRYFGICQWERYLIEDTVQVFSRSATPSSAESPSLITTRQSAFADREAYADTIVETFRGWTNNKVEMWATGAIALTSELALVTFGVGGAANGKYTEASAEQRVEGFLSSIRESTTQADASVSRCLRGFAFYEKDAVNVLKPLSRRFWTRTAALNDADEFLCQMFKENQWHA
jgi:hypothetical protein